MTAIFLDNKFLLINFSDIFQVININFINELHEFDLLSSPINFKNISVKRLFKHHIIYNICEKLLDKQDDFKRVIIMSKINIPIDYQEYYDYEQLIKEINSILKQLQKNLPIFIFFPSTPVDFKKFSNKYFRDEGEGIDIKNLIYSQYDKMTKKTYDFRNIKKFTKKYQLNFLSKGYFDQIKTKQILYK